MKIVRSLCLFVVAASLASAPALAGGALVLRGEDIMNWIGFNDWPERSDLLVYGCAEPTCGCGAGEPTLYDWMLIFQPNGVIKYRDHGEWLMKVYRATIDDVVAAGFCGFLATRAPLAQGMGVANQWDNSIEGPVKQMANSWGFVVTGELEDLAGTCGGGTVELNMVYRLGILPQADYPACWPDCIEIRVAKGPRLICPE